MIGNRLDLEKSRLVWRIWKITMVVEIPRSPGRSKWHSLGGFLSSGNFQEYTALAVSTFLAPIQLHFGLKCALEYLVSYQPNAMSFPLTYSSSPSWNTSFGFCFSPGSPTSQINLFLSFGSSFHLPPLHVGIFLGLVLNSLLFVSLFSLLSSILTPWTKSLHAWSKSPTALTHPL